jgi:glutamyl/glutaminyl-tRNA synthetase
VAVTGAAASPPLGDTLAILGKDVVLRRIDRCLAECR